MLPYDSLREKLVQPFVLLGFIVSATLSLSTFALLANIEERAIVRTLSVELESFRHRRGITPDALPANSSLLRGEFLPSDKLRHFRPPPPNGQYLEIRTLEDTDYSILVSEVGGRPFALLYDRSYIKSNISHLALLLLSATGLMTLLSFIVGYRLTRKVIQPIVRLLGEVSLKARQQELASAKIGFATKDYPHDEIGQLVHELDMFSLRLYEFIERESYFAADVSHELRTPVAVIASTVEVLAEIPDLPDPVRRRIETIGRQAARMSQILEAMLLLATEDRDDSDPCCSLPEIIDEVVADCLPSLSGRPVSIKVTIAERRTLPIERSLAYVLISNILRNACNYTQEGLIAVHLDHQGLEVVDSGIGIPEERFPELFKRHAKGELSTGHGLGLSIVARISQRLGWKIEMRSESGKGTRFRFSFPEEPTPWA